MKHRQMLACCAIAGIALFLAAPVQAASFANVTATATAGVLGRPGASDTSNVSGLTSASTGANAVVSEPITTTSNFFVSGSGGGTARLGLIGASANAFVQSTHTGTLTFLADNLAGGLGTVQAHFFIDDLLVTPTAGGTATTVPLALRLDLSGGLGAGASLNEPPVLGFPAGASGTASVAVSVEAGGLSFNGTRSYFNNNHNQESFGATGLLAGGDLFITPVFDVLVGSPFSLTVAMTVVAGASTNVTHGNANANASFGNTLSFPIGGPVFEVPDGFTVNSLSAGIVDNRFGVNAAVPEPSIALLLGIGVAALGGVRRFRVRRRHQSKGDPKYVRTHSAMR